MRAVRGVKYSHLVLGLFFFGLMTTAVALFGITYMGSRSVAEHEIAQRAERKNALSNLVFTTLLEQLENQVRNAAINRDLVNSIIKNDELAIAHILAHLGQNTSGLALDVLMLVNDAGDVKVDMSYSLVDLSTVLPSEIIKETPSNMWQLFADDFATPPAVVSAIAIPVIDNTNGTVVGRLVGGTTLNRNDHLTRTLADLLAVESVAIVHDLQHLASVGELGDEKHFAQVGQYLASARHHVENGRLYMKSVLAADDHGHPIHVFAEKPNTILADLRASYVKQFLPFLIYVSVAALVAAFLLNRFTAPALNALLQFAGARHADGEQTTFLPGRIAEYNRLGAKLEEAFAAIESTNAQFKELIEGSLQGVYVLRDKQIVYVNQALLKMLRYPPDAPEALQGKPFKFLYAPEEVERMQTYNRLRNAGEIAPTVYEVECVAMDGSQVWLEQHVRMTDWNGEPAIYVTMLDVTARKEQERLLEQQTNEDQLTKLANRSLFLDRLRQSIAQSERTGNMAALLVADADRFKTINDTHGHGIGDEIIKILAERVSALAEWNQTVARLGGDEFALILPEVEDEWELESKAQAILDAFATRIDLGEGKEFGLTTSIGITVCPYDGTDEFALMRQADAALYQAKSDGGNRFRFFSRQMNDRAEKMLQTEAALRAAIETESLTVYFQPIIDFATGTITGCEALARCTDPELGPISPTDFIPVAEDSGLIIPLGELVLRKACAFHAMCEDNGLFIPSVGVNISPRQCREDGFVQSVKHILADTRMDPRCLRLEITENVMFDSKRIDPAALLTAIKLLGVKISLDDFGTGYSSLSYLKQLPIDTLKIDRTFVSDLEWDTDAQALVEAVISMAAKLGIEVICEGAETLKQCEIITSLGCREIQGFYLGKPMPAEEFLKFGLAQNYPAPREQQAG